MTLTREENSGNLWMSVRLPQPASECLTSAESHQNKDLFSWGGHTSTDRNISVNGGDRKRAEIVSGYKCSETSCLNSGRRNGDNTFGLDPTLREICTHFFTAMVSKPFRVKHSCGRWSGHLHTNIDLNYPWVQRDPLRFGVKPHLGTDVNVTVVRTLVLTMDRHRTLS
jgi:hypothetical protein